MDAKDTVDKYLDEMGWLLSKDSMQYAWLVQLVEISFKAGKLQGAIESVDKLIAAGRKAGIREVVEWINKKAHIEQSLVSKVIDGAIYRTMLESQWQAKLKEWGIEDG